jgi:hypothetical protein
MRTALLVLLACAPLALAVDGTPPAVLGGKPLLLRLEGDLHANLAQAREKSPDVATLGFLDGDGGKKFLGIEKARTIGADQGTFAKDVLNDLKPFDPNLLLTGPGDLLERIRNAPVGTRVVLEGLLDRGQHTYLLRDVQVG